MMLFVVCFHLHVQATYEKGTTEEIEEFIYQFLDVNGDGILGRYRTGIEISCVVYLLSDNSSSNLSFVLHLAEQQGASDMIVV